MDHSLTRLDQKRIHGHDTLLPGLVPDSEKCVNTSQQRGHRSHGQTAAAILSFPRSGNEISPAAVMQWPDVNQVSTFPSSRRVRSAYPFESGTIHLMSAFDPNSFRQAIAEFSPRRPKKFQDLLQARDVIAELRRKSASYEAIADLLTQHCLPTSKTAIAQFCHQVLGEIVRPHRRSGRKRSPITVGSTGVEKIIVPAPRNDLQVAEKALPDAAANEQPSSPARGPRIAQIRMLKSQNA
jgi:hypothetical protein